MNLSDPSWSARFSPTKRRLLSADHVRRQPDPDLSQVSGNGIDSSFLIRARIVRLHLPASSLNPTQANQRPSGENAPLVPQGTRRSRSKPFESRKTKPRSSTRNTSDAAISGLSALLKPFR